MKKLDKFILKSFVGPFVAILAVVLFILVLQFLFIYIDELVGKGLGMGIIMEFLFWGSCTILPRALPLATLLAGMMIMGQMTGNNELTALKAAGISVARVMKPLIVASVLISIGTFFTVNNLVPLSYEKIYLLRSDILKTKEEIKIPPGTFYDGIEGYILRVENRDETTGLMTDIMVYDHTGSKGNNNVTLADSAYMTISDAKDYLSFILYNGTNYVEQNSVDYSDTSVVMSRTSFSRQELIIPLENYAYHKSEDGDRFSDQIMAMNVRQLSHQKDSLEALERETRASQFEDITKAGGLMKGRQLDTGALGWGRRNFESEDYLQWQSPKDKAKALKQSAERVNSVINKMQSFSRDTYEYTFYLRRSRLELLNKFSVALACLLLFFIGAPLGTLIRKGGLGTPAIISVLFFVLYYVAGVIGSKLAKDGAVTAATGAFVSSYVMAPIGAYLMWKSMNDASIEMDGFKVWWRRTKSRIMGFFRKTRIVYMGTPEFAVGPLDRLIKDGYKVVGVVTVADKPSGRGLKVSGSAVKRYAVVHDIPVLQPTKLKDPDFLRALSEWKADLFVVVAFRMLPEEVWRMPRLGTFNLHAALLPQYRGAAPINWAVINGESMTGVTTFMIDKNIDTGGIILRQEYRIKDSDTLGDVHDALMEIGSTLVSETVGGIIEGNVETRVQKSFIQGSEVLKPAPKLTRELCHIDWRDTTRNVHNLIRGLSPWPCAWTELCREGGDPVQLRIYGSQKMEATAEPGTILTDGRTYLAFATLDGAVKVTDLQLSGKKRMGVEDFLRGMRDIGSYSTTTGTSRKEKERLCNIV